MLSVHAGDDSDQISNVMRQIELAVCNLIAAQKNQKHYKAQQYGQWAYPRKSARHLPINRPAARALKS